MPNDQPTTNDFNIKAMTTTLTSTKKTFNLKPISKEGIDSAINKAEHYRLLNQPRLAESICLDVLEVDPKNQKANIILLLSLSDQFGQSHPSAPMQAQMIADNLNQAFDQYC